MKRLQETIKELKAILGSDKKLRDDRQGRARRPSATSSATSDARSSRADAGEMNIEDLIAGRGGRRRPHAKPATSRRVGRQQVPHAGTRGPGRAGREPAEADLVKEIVHTTTHAHLLMFSNQGRVFRLRAHEIPMKERTARGTALVNLLPLRKDESIQAIIATKDFDARGLPLLRHQAGSGEEDADARVRQEPPRRLHRDQPAQEGRARPRRGDDRLRRHHHGHPQGQSIRFDEKNVRSMGRGAAGVRGIRLQARATRSCRATSSMPTG